MEIQRFYQACNPTHTLDTSNPLDAKYYIDLSKVRGSDVIRQIERTITSLSPFEPTCQLFSGHIGCGKSTELKRLKTNLETKGFYVVYFESTKDLDVVDVDVSDILLAIARQVSENLEKEGIFLEARGFKSLLSQMANFLKTPIDIAANVNLPGVGQLDVNSGGELSFSLPAGIGSITAKARNSPNLRARLRQYLEPRTTALLNAINDDLLTPARRALKEKGKAGLVVLVDNLDRIGNRVTPIGRLQPAYIFIDRGNILRKLGCHVVYTIPLVLIFSNESENLKQRLGGGIPPKILPMVPVRLRSGESSEPGIELMRQILLARAFPHISPQERLQQVEKIVDHPDTLTRLCTISGGHARNLLGLFFRCLQEEELPIPRECLEMVIKEYRDNLLLSIDDAERTLIINAMEKQHLNGEKEYQVLLPSMFCFEYKDENGRWFGINPALAESPQFAK